MCWSPYKTFIHLRHHENGQRLAGNVGKREVIQIGDMRIGNEKSACRKRSPRMAWTLDPRVCPLRRGSMQPKQSACEAQMFRINA